MDDGTRKITVADMFWIVGWSAVFMWALRTVSWEPLYSGAPICRYSVILVLSFGLFGVYRKQPLAWGLLGVVLWLIVVAIAIPVVLGARE